MYLIKEGVLEPFCNLLDTNDAKTLIVVLDGISNILEVRLFLVLVLFGVFRWILSIFALPFNKFFVYHFLVLPMLRATVAARCEVVGGARLQMIYNRS